MKQSVNVVCSILVLFCLISMYIPVVAPRYPANEYHPANGSYEADYFYNGDYYLAKRHWSITDYVFAGGNTAMRVLISLAQAVLVVRAWLIVSGQSQRRLEILCSAVNLAIVAFFLAMMMRSMWSCRWAALVVMGLLTVMSVLMSVFAQSDQGAGKR